MISETAHAECVRLLELLTNPRVQESWSWVFMTPVDIPGYEKVIKRPMDLGTIKKNLGVKPSRCRFKSHEKFARDVRLVFQNALVYNKDDQDVKGSVYAAAQHLLRVFETAYAKAIDNVFKADDAAKAAHREAKEEKRRSEGGEATRREGEGGSSSSSSHHHHRSSSSHHRHREDGEENSKHKHKHSKKDKKSKKSKKKSKDREKDREHRHSSSSNGESKKKSHRSEHESSVAVSSSVATKEVVPRSSATPPAPVSHSSTSLVKREQTSGVKMTDTEMTACLSLLMKLIKYKEGNISPAAPFLQPVDLTHFPDYRIKVPNRMHLYGVQKKLRSGSYPTIDAFAYDMRLIFSNCLVYNSDVILSKVMRNHAVTLMKLFESQFAKIGGSWPGVPERWKCHQIIHEILAHRTDGQETAQWFKYPVESYYDSPDQIPYNYYKTVTEPMDIGTVSSKLHLGEYKHTSEFVAGMKLVFDNCIRYWKPDPQGQTYCESAEMLLRVLHSRSAAFGSSASSSGVSAEKQRSTSSSSSKAKPIPTGLHASSSVTPSVPVVSATGSEHEKTKKKSSSKSSSKSLKSLKPRESGGGLPEKDICLGIMKQLRGHKMKGFRGIEIKTAGPFLTAVDTTKYPDYLTIVSEPMDFAKIERKLKSDRYGSVDEFSADVHLIFSNCHKYNSDPVEGADIRAMATNLRNYFVELCNEKLGPLDGMLNGPTQTPTQTPTHSAQSTATLSSSTAVQSKSSVLTRPLDAKTRAPVAGAGLASLHKPVKKSPAPSPTKKSSSASAAGLSSNSTPVRDLKREKQLPSSSSRKAPEAKPVFSSKPVSQVKPEAAPIAAAASSSVNKDQALDISNAADLNLTPEEAKRLRKEMKEKRRKEKKEKKEKKKKDKEKKREKKEKRERSKLPTAVQDTGLTTQESSTTGSFASATTAAAPLPPPAPVAVPVKAVPSDTPSTPAVASKRGQVEPHLGSSTKKSKKHKKSDLNSWESACDRVLNRLAKIEQVAKLHFNHPLLEVFPHLTAEYSSLISEPMDLRTLREQLHSHTLIQAEFLRKGRLIFQNAVKFNCADDPASVQVRDMSAHLLWYFDSLCAELQIIPVPEVSGEQGRAKREQLRRERAEFVSTVPVELKAKECQKLLRVLNSQKHDKNCWPFRKPVRMLFPGLSPDYFDIIKTPMDLSTIADNLTDFEYKVHGEFIRDVRLTFENAMIYNRADKDREGWSVYSAAVHMLAVVDDLWGDVTLEVTEKTRRRELVRKERMSDPKRKRSDLSDIGDERERKFHKHHHSTVGEETGHKHHHKHHHKSSKHRDEAGSAGIGAAGNTGSAATPSKSAAPVATATSVVGTIVVGGANGARDDTNASDATATRVKLQLNIGRNMERMNKQERKAEEKRRKRARREEEMARTEKRRRTAVAATDDALREAEIRSRRKMQKLEMAEAVHLREERERRAAEEEAERARRAQMKLNVAAWTGVLIPASSKKRTGFWAKKHVKLQIPVVFQPPAINA